MHAVRNTPKLPLPPPRAQLRRSSSACTACWCASAMHATRSAWAALLRAASCSRCCACSTGWGTACVCFCVSVLVIVCVFALLSFGGVDFHLPLTPPAPHLDLQGRLLHLLLQARRLGRLLPQFLGDLHATMSSTTLSVRSYMCAYTLCALHVWWCCMCSEVRMRTQCLVRGPLNGHVDTPAACRLAHHKQPTCRAGAAAVTRQGA